MQSGFNTNFRYRGIVFHVQTEDSGRSNPHVITHLFHGGNILASMKSDYADKLESDDLEPVVRGLMEAQHRAMLEGLKNGEQDAVIEKRLADELGLLGSAAEESGTTDPTLTPPPTKAPAPPPAEPARERESNAFGQNVVSQKPLDEVVLDYLLESARKRKRPDS